MFKNLFSFTKKLFGKSNQNLKESKRYILKIQFNQNETIECCLLHEKEIIPIELIPNQNQYSFLIRFDRNEIVLFQQHEQTIDFISDLKQNENEFKEYSFEYQGKTYSVVAEVLIAIIMNEFKSKIEKNYIIDKVIVENNAFDPQIMNRINVSLDSIGFPNIPLNSNITYDYKIQGEILFEIVQRKNEYERCKRYLQRAKEFLPIEKHHLLEINQNEPFTDQTLYEIGLQFTIKEKEQMKISTLDNYCVFLASMYFDSIDDFYNLEMGCRRFQGNMTKFHYNPISLNINTIQHFPNVETLHCYSIEDEYLESGRIERYVDWRHIRFNAIYEKYIGKNIDFKKESFIKEEFQYYVQKRMKENNPLIEFVVPNGYHYYDPNCFSCSTLCSITLPSSMTSLSNYCFSNCPKLSVIKGLKRIRDIGMGCFFNTPLIGEEQHPLVKISHLKQFELTDEEMKQLENWSSRKIGEIIFDSIVDDWSSAKILNERIVGKKQLIFLITDGFGEIFGFYFNPLITIQLENYRHKWMKYSPIRSDLNSFLFNLRSTKGRLESPMKFEIVDPNNVELQLSYPQNEKISPYDKYLFQYGGIGIGFKKSKFSCYLYNYGDVINYHHIPSGLCGRSSDPRCGCFDLFVKKLIVIQMK